MSTTLILGGGFGGVACARALAARLPESHRIMLFDRSPHFLVGAAKTWVMLGERPVEGATCERRSLLPARVVHVDDEVRGIDSARREVRTSAGALTCDHLVIALGADLDPGAIPGLAEASQSFYTLDGAARLHSALERLQGGKVVLLIPRVPFKCPPAPYEAAMMMHAYFERRGVLSRTRLEIFTVERAPMPTAGLEIGRTLIGELHARGIGYHPLKRTAEVDATRRVVRFEDGTEAPYDLLIAIPPHRAPRVVVEAGLAEPAGWIPVDPVSLEVKRPGVAPHVYAVGDVTSVPLPGRWDPAVPLVLPKAGVFAAAEGEVVAERIAAAVTGG